MTHPAGLTAVLAVATGVLGLLIGSFLNVVIYRVPRHESLLFPSSHCPKCAAPIKARHNVPVVGWLALHGRCASCQDPISARYPLVELGTGVLFALITLRLGPSPYLPACLFLAAVGITLAMIDVDGQQEPYSIIASAFIIGVALLLPATVTTTDMPTALGHVVGSIGGAFALALGTAVVAMASQRTIESGVLLVAALVGFYLGWLSWLVALVAAAGSMAVVLLTRSALTSSGRLIGASSLPIGMLVLAASGLTFLAPLPL